MKVKLEIEVKGLIGDTVYEIQGYNEKIHKACKTCRGTMKVVAKLGDREIETNCPDCLGKSVETPRHIRTFYSINKRVINSIIITREKTIIGLKSSFIDEEIDNNDIDSSQFVMTRKKIKCYLSEDAAKGELQRLNKEEQDKYDAFVSDQESAYIHIGLRK